MDTEIEYVPEEAPQAEEFAHVFQRFRPFKQSEPIQQEVQVVQDVKNEEEKKDVVTSGLPSKRKLRETTRMSVAELKLVVPRPELVELHDVTAKYPIFLLQLKSVKNSVPVPAHWSSKRKYLQGKRGFEKIPFQLPDFIRQTGIMEMRDFDQDKTLKAKMREKVQPKMGKLNMDYQQLHDAFFKWQTKPRLSTHGDLYYEGKEFEKKFKKKPGELSNELREALGMPVGENAHLYPPPWMKAMKRHGPPPSYPYLNLDYLQENSTCPS